MNEFHQADLKGFEVLLPVLQRIPNIVKVEHTESDTDRIDVRLTGVTSDRRTIVCAIEQKHRNCLSSDYPTVMFNKAKFVYLVNHYIETGEIPVFVSSYSDAVLFFNLASYPRDKIVYETKPICRKTLYGGEKILQERMMLDPRYAYKVQLHNPIDTFFAPPIAPTITTTTTN